jgi:hypothetical protein
MRSALRLLGTRYGASLTLVLLIVMVVAAFRGLGGSDRSSQMTGPASVPSRSVSTMTSGGDDGVRHNGVGDDDAPGAPTSISASTTAEARRVATRFTTAWLNSARLSGKDWRAALSPDATPSLMQQLASTDPSTVPAHAIDGDMSLLVRAPTLVEATVPLDSGTLRLGVVMVDGRWKVDSIVWKRPT